MNNTPDSPAKRRMIAWTRVETIGRCLPPESGKFCTLFCTPDLQAARAEALETLVSYGARTRAELMNAVQVIILGFSTLDTLGEAKTSEMSPSLRLRFRGCANNLNRSCQKTEQTLVKRLGCDVPAPTPMTADPVGDIPESQADATLQRTQDAINTARDRLAGARPEPSRQPRCDPPMQSQADRDKRIWGAAMMQSLAEMGMPVQPLAPG